MFKVAIIDDEYWTVKGIEASCPWHQYQCEIVLATTSPREGLDYICHHEVDFLFIDINMSEMSGLEVIQTLRDKGIDTECVIISGYSEFEYAKTALRYRVSEYILKPIEKEILSETVERLVLHKEKEMKQNQEHTGEQLLYIEKLMNDSTLQLANLFTEKREGNQQGYQGVILKGEEHLKSFKKELETIECAYHEYTVGENKYFIILQMKQDLCKKLDLIKRPVEMGISTYMTLEATLGRVYYESDLAFCNNFLLRPRVYQYKKQALMGRKIMEAFYVVDQKVYEEVYRKLAEEREKYTLEECVLLYNCTAAFCNYYYADSNANQIMYPPATYDQLYLEYRDVGEFVEYLGEMVRGIGANWNDYGTKLKQGKMNKSESIEEILQYLNSHYTETLYLNDVAKQFFYNPTYLSSLFRKQLDKTFTEELTSIRMKKSCNYLLNTKKSIVEIAGMVGYSDYCYYSKVFKKTYGLTPIQYRKRNEGEV